MTIPSSRPRRNPCSITLRSILGQIQAIAEFSTGPVSREHLDLGELRQISAAFVEASLAIEIEIDRRVSLGPWAYGPNGAGDDVA